MTIRLDASADAHFTEAAHAFLHTLGDAIRDDAHDLVAKKSHRLADSLTHEVEALTVYVGSTDVDYSTYVELGTRPHEIRPRTKKALYWPGAQHPVAKVDHPGTQPQPYLRPALLQPRWP